MPGICPECKTPTLRRVPKAQLEHCVRCGLLMASGTPPNASKQTRRELIWRALTLPSAVWSTIQIGGWAAQRLTSPGARSVAQIAGQIPAPKAHIEIRVANQITGMAGGSIVVVGGKDGSIAVADAPTSGIEAVSSAVESITRPRFPAHSPVELRRALWRMRQFPKAPGRWYV